MLKALISDDEMKVCALIQALVDWDELGVELVGVGYDGYETLDLIRKYKPEIVITDIRMPGMDGIELIKKVREEGILSNFIVISGYRQFEFARKALKYGVDDYLLKPIIKDELMAAIRKICQQYEEKTSVIDKVQSGSNIKLLQQHFIAHYTFDNSEDAEYNAEKVNEMCQLNFCDGYYQVLLAKIDGIEEMSDVETESVFTDVMSHTETFLRDYCHELVCFKKDYAVYGIINFEEKPKSEEFLSKLSEKLQTAFLKNNQLKITLSLGGIKERLFDINRSAAEAIEAIKCRITYGTGGMIYFEALKSKSKSLHDILGIEWRREFSTLLEMLDQKIVKERLLEYFNEIDNMPDTDPRLYHDLCHTCISIVNKVLQYTENIYDDGNVLTALNMRLFNSQTPQEMFKALSDWVDIRISTSINDRTQHERLPIRKVKQYIKDNYMDKISLEDAAEEVHFNPSYLSAMFKSEVGINFNDYLIQVRIDAAKEILRKGELNMDNVAMNVGYQNTRYFSRLFKKMVGITPSNYRKLYS